ncbi:type II toxin-antitoxin system VapC family toxin [Ottowia testudinis]|uniref:Type II toxin-antitoxin system VapC family toxin n=1 Tax=Ottowia testudinis TaxID=2816950 RepID=A0A975CGZ3_9BURK|nr:type II toxin-antitoxin system VapC family toxin [Ottowia testudinis]QTD43994.1 type II toxin-antitoxin system VapC family toxin [Ottowia testudinis]
MILVDSSVLIDLIEKTPEWFDWTTQALFDASQRDQLGINALVYAEIARTFAGAAKQNEFITSCGIQYLHIPPAAAHAASVAHRAYRSAGGNRAATLPDFFIGAHAAVEGFTLMTRDAKRISTYFPSVPTLSPR